MCFLFSKIDFLCLKKLNVPRTKMINEATKSPISMNKPFSISNRFVKLKPAIKKYMDVRKKERKVD